MPEVKTKISNKFKKVKKNSKKYIFISLFVLLGAGLLLASYAATPVAHFEAESGTFSGDVSALSDNNASGGHFLKFSGGSQSSGGTVLPGAVDVKESCKNLTDETADGTTIRTEFPHDGTTGPEVAGLNEDKLPPSGVSGKWTVTEDGAVIDSVHHYGTMVIEADNVTIKNSIICGGNSSPLIIQNSGQNLVVENSIVRGEWLSDGTKACTASLGYGNYTLLRSELTACADGVKTSGVIDIRYNWFHDNFTDRGGDGSGTHNDTVQQVNGNSPSFVFEGNSAYQDPCTSNRHFQMAPSGGAYSAFNMRINNNFFYGIMGLNFSREFTAPGGVISNNTFAGSWASGPFNSGLLYSGGNVGEIQRTGNEFESGEPANTNPSNYECAP